MIEHMRHCPQLIKAIITRDIDELDQKMNTNELVKSRIFFFSIKQTIFCVYHVKYYKY